MCLLDAMVMAVVIRMAIDYRRDAEEVDSKVIYGLHRETHLYYSFVSRDRA